MIDEMDSQVLKIKSRVMDMVEATLEQELRTDCFAALIPDPTAVHASKVVDPKLQIRKELSRLCHPIPKARHLENY